VKKELPKKDSTSTKPPRKHQAQRKLSRYAPPVHKTPICHKCGVNSHVRPRGPQLQKDSLDLMQDILLQGISDNSKGLFL
jgi:hypothetical protein